MLPTTMTAIFIARARGPEVLQPATRPVPEPDARVCALVNGGCYAQYCIAAEPVTLPIPAGFDLKQAASLPEALFTAWLEVVH